MPVRTQQSKVVSATSVRASSNVRMAAISVPIETETLIGLPKMGSIGKTLKRGVEALESGLPQANTVMTSKYNNLAQRKVQASGVESQAQNEYFKLRHFDAPNSSLINNHFAFSGRGSRTTDVRMSASSSGAGGGPDPEKESDGEYLDNVWLF